MTRTFWSPKGFLRPPRYPEPDDFVVAEAAGLMFRTVTLDHDEVVRRARSGVANVDARLVSDAFLASLSARRHDLRSALASYHLARVLPEHDYAHRPFAYTADHRPSGSICTVCGHIKRERHEYDLNVLSFERQKWGGARFTSPLYIAFDLAQAAKWGSVLPAPGDLDLMHGLLRTIRDLGRSDPEARPQHLEKLIAPLLGGNQYRRRVVLIVLAYCGVLEPRGGPSFTREWIGFLQRPESPEWKNSWPYPMHAWRGRDGVNEARLHEIFPGLAGDAR